MQQYPDVRDHAAARPRGNGLKISLVWFVACFGALLCDVVLSAVYWVADLSLLENAAVYSGIMGGWTVLFVLPLLLGVNRLAYRLYRTGDADAVCALYPYRSLPRSWLCILIGVVPPALAGASVYGCIKAYGHVSELALIQRYPALALVAAAVVALTGLTLVWLFIRLWLRTALLPAYAFRGDMSLWQALAWSFRASEGRMRRLIRFYLGYLGWLLLDCLTLGVLWLLHTAPRFYMDYIKLADTLLERVKDNE